MSVSKQKVVRKKYSPQFKKQTIERAERDGIPKAAQDLGLPEACSGKCNGKCSGKC